MDERDKKTELLVGLFLTIGLIFLGLLILQFSSVRELFKDTYTITVPFPDGSGVKEGTPVLFGGLKIGKVPRRPEHDPSYTGVIIALEIYNNEKVPSDAKFAIGTAGLLGDSYIEIRPGSGQAKSYYEDGAVVPKENIASSSGLGALQDTAKDLSNKVDVALEDLRTAIADIRTSLKKINEGVLSDKSIEDLKSTFAHLDSVITRLDERTLSEATSTDVKEAVASFKEAAKSLEAATKKLDPIVAKADSVMTSADKAVKTIDESAEALGKVGDDMRKGPGLLPALIHDRNLKNEFSMLITNLRQRGVLWYKDKAGEEQAERQKAQQQSQQVRPKR